ncbi:hypothetical protein PIB30_019108 [Stylosanthes scabra]|uniref:Uncharacterized protein n=1 Tax=Stylosanthes scabra TaxID=79078 RepID=A0ABU6V9N7_9FABA|nr:hypothetical protein [Stylosanthes scabra]
MANKNDITLAIVVLMSLAIFCTAIDEFYDNTISKDTWTTSYFIASNFSFDYCVEQCKFVRDKKGVCWMYCIEKECGRLHPHDKEKKHECITHLKDKYDVEKMD